MSFRKIQTSNLASANTVFDDPIIVINNKGVVDNKDVGILAKTTANAYTGLFRDGDTKDYYLVEQYVQSISNNDLVPAQATLSDLHVATLNASAINMSGSIIPDTNVAYDLGSLTNQWRDIYVGPGSLYVNGQRVLSDEAGTITLQADTNQSIAIKATGTGVVSIDSPSAIQVSNHIHMAPGKTIAMTDGTPVKFAQSMDANNNNIINVGAPTLSHHATNKDYVDTAISSISVTTDISGLTDTNITSVTDGQILQWDSATSKWINVNAPSGMFDGDYNSLTNKPTIPSDVNQLTDTTGLLTHFDGAYSSLTGAPVLATVATSGSYTDLINTPTIPTVPTNVSAFTNDSGYLTSETPDVLTTLSHNPTTKTLSYVDESGNTTNIDLTQYIDDTNLARITSGTVNGTTGVATFTRDDATTFTVDFSALFDDTNLTRITGGSFNTSNGVLTLTRSDATTAANIDLDGRYVQPSTSFTSGTITPAAAGTSFIGTSSLPFSGGTFNNLTVNTALTAVNHRATDNKTYSAGSSDDFQMYFNGVDFIIHRNVLTAGGGNIKITDEFDQNRITFYPSNGAIVASSFQGSGSGLTNINYNNLSNKPTNVSAFTNDAGYLTSETITSLSINANVLSYVDEAGNTTNVDLSLYLDDTNLARIASGSVNPTTGIATFTRDDATSFEVDFSALLDDTNLVTSVNGQTGAVNIDLTETDPVFTASAASSITTTNINNWNTAYSWGNHASAGYLTSYTETDTLASVTSRGSVTTGGITVNGNVSATSFTGDGSGLTNLPNPSVSDGSITPAKLDREYADRAFAVAMSIALG